MASYPSSLTQTIPDSSTWRTGSGGSGRGRRGRGRGRGRGRPGVSSQERTAGGRSQPGETTEDLEVQLQKAEDALARVRQKREEADAKDRPMYDRREKALDRRIAALKRRMGADDLSGPIMDAVGGFVGRKPIVSLLLAALAGALLARR